MCDRVFDSSNRFQSILWSTNAISKWLWSLIFLIIQVVPWFEHKKVQKALKKSLKLPILVLSFSF